MDVDFLPAIFPLLIINPNSMEVENEELYEYTTYDFKFKNFK